MRGHCPRCSHTTEEGFRCAADIVVAADDGVGVGRGRDWGGGGGRLREVEGGEKMQWDTLPLLS